MNRSMMPTHEEPRISVLGSTAMLFEAPGELELAHQRRIWALAQMAQIHLPMVLVALLHLLQLLELL